MALYSSQGPLPRPLSPHLDPLHYPHPITEWAQAQRGEGGGWSVLAGAQSNGRCVVSRPVSTQEQSRCITAHPIIIPSTYLSHRSAWEAAERKNECVRQRRTQHHSKRCHEIAPYPPRRLTQDRGPSARRGLSAQLRAAVPVVLPDCSSHSPSTALRLSDAARRRRAAPVRATRG